MGEQEVKMQEKEKPTGPPAVSADDFRDFGCAHCGRIFGTKPHSEGGTVQYVCAGCGKTTLVVDGRLERSTLGVMVGAQHVFPEVMPHPRLAWPIDREALIRERVHRDQLSRWLRLAYGGEVGIIQTAEHIRRWQKLPIMAVFAPNENVLVNWFGEYVFVHILGLQLRQPLPATLMHPIASVFGHFTLTNYIDEVIAPHVDIRNAYSGNEDITRFIATCEDGFAAALVIRYLRELSKLDTKRIADICFLHVASNKRWIDNDAVDYEVLLEVLGLTHRYVNGSLNPTMTGLTMDFLDKVVIELNDPIVHGQCAVQVTLAEGIYRLSMPVLHSSFGVNHKVGQLTREFVFRVPTIPDAALTAFFLVKVLAPMMGEMRQMS